MTELVYVQDQNGRPLMPTRRLGKVRHWLRSGRAVVVQHTPFTIRLMAVSDSYVQPLTAGIDIGTAHLDVSVVGETAELLSMEIGLRTDISGLLTERHSFRCSRRGRKTPYREPRFLNRVRADELMQRAFLPRLKTGVSCAEFMNCRAGLPGNSNAADRHSFRKRLLNLPIHCIVWAFRLKAST